MMKRVLALVVGVLLTGLATAQFSPSNPECIAPANPGGGWDMTCRAMTRAMTESGALDTSVRVSNIPGAGGAIAFANVVTQRNDDDNLIVAASPGTTARLAQDQYPGFDEDDVRWIGALGADFGLIAVAADSPFETLDDLMNAVAEDPSSLNFGGGSGVGGQDHMKVLLLAQEAGIDPLAIRYTSFDGGGEAMTALLGGFIDVFPGDASESQGQLEAGDIRILATLTPERLPEPYADVPTARELGYDTEWVIFRGFWGPGNMSEEAYDFWVNVLNETAQSPEWAEIREDVALGEYALTGEAFESFAKKQVQDLRVLSRTLGLIE